MRAQEFENSKNTFVEMFRKFLPIAMKVIGLKSLPKMIFEKEVESPDQPTFGQYVNGEHVLYVGLANRHPNDILRTIAHELVHYKQDTEHQLDGESGMTGSPEENQANAIAGVVMRYFNKQYPEYLKTKPIVAETWSNKYKSSINCSDPKGFSQRAHCQGRKKNEEWNGDDRDSMFYGGRNDPDGPRTRQDYRVTDKIDWSHPELTTGMKYRIRADANRILAGIKGLDATEKFYNDYYDYLLPHHKDNLEEKLNRTGSNELVIFDIDDTLLHTTAQIKVIDSETGNPKLNLTNQQFNNYKLKPGEEFDFGEFRDAAKFEEESVPIGPMLDKLRSDLASGKNVVMLTARADFDNQKAVWRTFKRHGIDINRDVHLYRAGNQPGDSSPAVKKAIHVSEWLTSGKYNRVVMYDDSEKNLSVFKSLEKRFPDVEFEAHHVSEEGKTKQVETIRKVDGQYRLVSKSGKNLGTYPTHAGAEKRERQVQYFKHVGENFADGKNPQDKGDSARHGIKKGMTIAQLKKVRSSDSASPRKKQLAHWQINMRSGRAKKK